MNTITELKKTVIEDINLEILMFTSDHPKRAGKYMVRQKDLDAGEVVGTTIYPNEEMAISAYAKLVRANCPDMSNKEKFLLLVSESDCDTLQKAKDRQANRHQSTNQ